jgi:hypothetical protein
MGAQIGSSTGTGRSIGVGVEVVNGMALTGGVHAIANGEANTITRIAATKRRSFTRCSGKAQV